jgi:hypothetical protein
MKTQLTFATGTNRLNLREAGRFPRLSALQPTRSRLAFESLEPRAMLTASPTFGACEWMNTLPEAYWMATCKAAESTSSPTTDGTSDGQTRCETTSVPVWGGRSTESADSNTVCDDSKTDGEDSKTVCDEQEVKTGQEDCKPTPSCDTAPQSKWEKSDCQEQPTPEQIRQALHEKIAAFLRKVGYPCDYEGDETPTTNCPTEKESNVKHWGSWCDDSAPKNCDEPESDSQQQRCNPDKTENCRVVDRCASDNKWSDSAVQTRHR